jgi:hypothetical protein
MTPYAQLLANQMRPEAQGAFAYEYQRYSKDPTVAFALTVVLGIVGGESYYLGDYKRGIWMSIAFLSGIALIVTIPMWICRCFTVQNECDIYNDYLAYSLAMRYWPMQNFQPTPEPSQAPPPPPQSRVRPTISNVPVPVRAR